METYSIKVIDSNAAISNNILKCASDIINRNIRNVLPDIQMRIASGLTHLFKNSDVYNSLVDGELAAHFGFWKGSGRAKANAIIAGVVGALEVEYHPFVIKPSSTSGSITVSFIRTDLQEVFSLSKNIIEIYHKSENIPEGVWLPWAEWLLLRGDDIIVSNYRIDLGAGKGRSGQAIMIKGGSWRVPPQFSGVRTNNWLTRSITRQFRTFSKLTGSILQEEIQKSIK
jgi:hypothetical protein